MIINSFRTLETSTNGHEYICRRQTGKRRRRRKVPEGRKDEIKSTSKPKGEMRMTTCPVECRAIGFCHGFLFRSGRKDEVTSSNEEHARMRRRKSLFRREHPAGAKRTLFRGIFTIIRKAQISTFQATWCATRRSIKFKMKTWK